MSNDWWGMGSVARQDDYVMPEGGIPKIIVRPPWSGFPEGPGGGSSREDDELIAYLNAIAPAPRRAPPEPIQPSVYDTQGFTFRAPKAPPRTEAGGPAEARSYEPTTRERGAQRIRGEDTGMVGGVRERAAKLLMGTTGLGESGIGLVDAVPGLGSFLGVEDALRGGDYANAAAGAMPGGRLRPRGANALRKAVEGATAPVERNVGFAPGSIAEMPAPAIGTRRLPTADDIAAIRAAAQASRKEAWPVADRDVFKTTPEAYAETTKLVPQVSIRDQLPGPLPGEKLPLKQRADPIVANTEAIADRIAERLDPMVREGSQLTKFYHTGPVIRGLEQYGGLSIPEANQFMRAWAGQGAATSPKTKTPPNMRNASFLLHERAQGTPMTRARFDAEGNVPGYGMMGSHVDKADLFAREAVNPWKNPKPFTFRENWSGNLSDVTTDTHNIRSTLYEFDKLFPGKLPREWFTSDEFYRKYKEEGFTALPPGAFKDTLGDTTVDKVSRQSEYLPMTEPWYRAADKLGIAPAEGQSAGWFSYGPITGLGSPPRTIPNLLNDQVVETARVLNVPPEKVVEWWARGRIPLAGLGGAAALAPGVMGELAASDRY